MFVRLPEMLEQGLGMLFVVWIEHDRHVDRLDQVAERQRFGRGDDARYDQHRLAGTLRIFQDVAIVNAAVVVAMGAKTIAGIMLRSSDHRDLDLVRVL
ncbi:MAG TPA: hypothetical protein VNZ55_04060, partial [Thermomicrobiales bacterium]|nr:hypothetical protein [Thermomicrobiales bacterium]